MVNVLIERYLNGVVLGNPYNMITAVRQRSQRKEEKFGQRLQSYAGVCSDAFNEHVLVNCFLRGLLPTTAAIVAAQVL